MRNCIFSVRATDAAITVMNSLTQNRPKTSRSPQQQRDDLCVQEALRILEKKLRRVPRLVAPTSAKDYLRLKLARYDYEMFGVLWLDTRLRLIDFSEMFRGTLTTTSVYPRELVRDAIKFNASSCILSHNHPSGECEPSTADHTLTRVIKQTLALIDVRVIDHIIVGTGKAVSMAERGCADMSLPPLLPASGKSVKCAVKA